MTMIDLVALGGLTWLNMLDAGHGVTPDPRTPLGRDWLTACEGDMWPNRMMRRTLFEVSMLDKPQLVIL